MSDLFAPYPANAREMFGAAEREGYDAGKAAALSGAERPNLSGEWADDPTSVTLYQSLGIDYDDANPDFLSEVCCCWEDGAANGYDDDFETE